MPEQVGGDQREVLRELRHQVGPALPVPQHAMEQDESRTAARLHVVHLVTVQRYGRSGEIHIHSSTHPGRSGSSPSASRPAWGPGRYPRSNPEGTSAPASNTTYRRPASSTW